MSGNVIQEFLVAIGFTMDQKSHAEFKKTMAEVQKGFLNIGLGVATATGAMAAFSATISTAGNKLGNITTGVDKFALSLYTTGKNARSLQLVMDTMGIKSLDDLKYINLMPEQRQQFMELRQLSNELAPDKETQEGIAQLRKLGFEFQKMQIEMAHIGLKVIGAIGRFTATPLFQIIPPALETIISLIAWIAEMIATKLGKNPVETAIGGALGGAGGALAGGAIGAQIGSIFGPAGALGGATIGAGIGLAGGAPLGAMAGGSLAEHKKEIKAASKNALETLFYGHHTKQNKVKSTPAIDHFLSSLDNHYNGSYTMTSGLAGRSGRSWHPKGLAVDMVPGDTSAKGYANFIAAAMQSDGMKKLNLELNGNRSAKVFDELRKMKMGHLVPQIQTTKTRDFTGEHLHATVRPITIIVNGAKGPEATGREVKRQLQANSGHSY